MRAQEWHSALAQALFLLDSRFFDEGKHPRDEHGKFTFSGGSDDLGEGYSANATIKDGVVHTTDVYDAARALSEGRKVDLDQPRGVSVLLDKLGEISRSMIAKGEKAPNYNLCNVAIKGTNLFCADSKGIPRVKMPQLQIEQDKPFFDYLKAKGYKVEQQEQYASHLRATQNELNGAKVAAIAEKIKTTAGYHSSSNPIFVSKDDYILDGHHRWAAEVGVDAADNVLANDKKMAVWRVDIPITKLLEEAEIFTGGEGKLSVEDEAARKALLTRTSAHTDWMNECVPAMMDSGKDQIVAVAACLNMWRQAWEETHPDGADDPGPSPKEADDESPLAEDKALRLALVRAWNEADHPRDEDGQFTDSGGDDEVGGIWDKPRPLTNIDAEKEAARKDPKRIAAVAERVAKRLDFDPANIEYTDEVREFKIGEQRYLYAGSYQFGDTKVKLYNTQLNVDNTAGVTAHEIGHRKFDMLERMRRIETEIMMQDKGPPPDPNHQYWWGRKGGTDAMMTPGGEMRPPYDDKYPLVHEWAKIQNMRPSLEQDDGITPYSKAYWTEWEKGDMRTDIAYHETIAEIYRAQGKMGKHAAGTGQGWRRVYDLTEKVWADREDMRDFSFLPEKP